MTNLRITDEMYDRIPQWVEEGMKVVEIAKMIGVRPTTLQVQCSRRGISLRKGGRAFPRTQFVMPVQPLPLNEAAVELLRKEARRLGKEPVELVTALLEKIVFDDLIDAVLDIQQQQEDVAA
jgi:hypothetical protein